ncbi:hypothetical protein PMIN01_07886 [Paraphaeosphaeria minitans]|uniref:Uncharacterized protein n=1 Tax=Paraphaeosphaeria minitans TaxID=565426 RepID=A0A9P6GEC4_9PLEO|nr:hypothetical protein PMIN01_07886 [Paraphaeosphaeria minitans]
MLRSEAARLRLYRSYRYLPLRHVV